MSAATAPATFDPCGPLPEGTVVLEASAGTGKTFTIAALAARFVAAGTPLDELLLVTFTRMATGELRERVRERLVSAEAALDRALAGALPGDADDVVRLLADGAPAEVRERRDRLARAIAGFDAATITTIHGFCLEVLGGLGVAGEVERDFVFAEDLSDLVEEVVDDLYVRRFREEASPFTRSEAAAVVRAAVANPGAPIAEGDEGGAGALRRGLAEAARRELEARKRRAATISYDDLLLRLRDTLDGPGGAAVAEALRARFRVVLVDEFQDTDPVQWDVVRRAFGPGDGTLVLIGDPKQAIYAFRGADVHAYLAAARDAHVRATLDVNWRSDAGLLEGYDALFADAQLGHPGIVYRRVRAAEGREPRLHGAPGDAPLRVRVVRRDTPGLALTYGRPTAQSAREHVAADLAGDVVALLDSGARVDRAGAPGDEPVHPGHVAVLVRAHRQAALVRDALAAVDVPTVINGAGSVFGTPAAADWLTLLAALERPASSLRAHAVALTPFLGWSAERVACADDAAWESVHQRLHGWARTLRRHGVAALAETVARRERVAERVLATTEGERWMTDLRHVGQLLHRAAAAEALGAAALTAWLRRRVAAAGDELEDEERTRRLESDAHAVQVLTIHRSKGLEFPVVYAPFLWLPTWLGRDAGPVDFHDGDVRTLDVSLEGAAYAEHRRRHEAEQRGEDLRLMYVALTRARHRAVIWWAGPRMSAESPLGRLLFARREDGSVDRSAGRLPGDDAVDERLRALAEAAPGRIAVERSVVGPPRPWTPAPRPAGDLAAGRFARTLDARWRRTSFSALTAGAYEARVASEPEDAVEADEPGPPDGAVRGEQGRADEERLRAVPSPLGAAPVGAQLGTVVHRVLEATDFAAPDLPAELGTRLAAARRGGTVDVGDPAALVAGLAAAVETPLGPLALGRRLRDVARADRLDELAFELPLAGGDRPRPRALVTLDALAAALRAHLPPGDPLAGYAERLGDTALQRAVRGYLTGSIDLVLRLRADDDDGGGGEPRFLVVDHKTNRLAPPGEELTAWHHRPEALAAEMQGAHYALQALIYLVALHRYLRWRLPGYDAERHLGGVLYLFLRGMTGPGTPVVDGAPSGVFAWRPPAALVHAVSDLFDGRDRPGR